METAAIVRLALLFGNTWIVNAVVISGVLLTIFLANLLVLGRRAPGLGVAWAGLAVFILINYMFPLRWAFELGFSLRVALSIALIGAPVFFAAVCFSRLFSREKIIGYALGINLIGAMAGGLLEYVYMVIGMRDVWLVALLVYLLAFVATHGVSIRSGSSSPEAST